jgi:serine phosphatase RsbU (regulator of sigma subunit)
MQPRLVLLRMRHPYRWFRLWLPAALLTGVIHGAVRSASSTASSRNHEASTKHLNQLLCERASRERFASIFWGYYDPATRLLPGAQVQQRTVAFEPGDVLVLCSDGVVEAVNAAGEEFGSERLRAVAERCLDRTADQIRDQILGSVRAFTAHAPLSDDRTLLAIRHQHAAEPVQAA